MAKRSVISKLASAMGRKDEGPNIELAESICQAKDKLAVAELVESLGAKKAVANDCIKVLFEVGDREPGLIASYHAVFIELLESRNNRLQWGAMTALACVARVNPAAVFKHLDAVVLAANQGSVITRDQAVRILVCLAGSTKFKAVVFPVLINQLEGCPLNQLPMYAELAASVVTASDLLSFKELLTRRLKEVEKASKRKRIEKVIQSVDQ